MEQIDGTGHSVIQAEARSPLPSLTFTPDGLFLSGRIQLPIHLLWIREKTRLLVE